MSSTIWAVVDWLNQLVLGYFLALNTGYLVSSLAAFHALRRHTRRLRALKLRPFPIHRFTTWEITKVAVERLRFSETFFFRFTANVSLIVASLRGLFIALERLSLIPAGIGLAVINVRPRYERSK